MLELPEAKVISGQLSDTVVGKTIRMVEANKSPHKFAFFSGDLAAYHNLLAGKQVTAAEPLVGQIEISAGNVRLAFSDGVNLRFFPAGVKAPDKHQLRIELDDGSSIICTVQMYGMLWMFKAGENDNPYYRVAKEKPTPLSDAFDADYFQGILDGAKSTLSIKALLATEQRIPGLGNGVLQDILFNAHIHPKTKFEALSQAEKTGLFGSVKQTLQEMTIEGGRDTEKDLFGNNGGYPTKLSSKTLDKPCPQCGGVIVRQAYLGGNVYFCPSCQPITK